MKFNLYTIYDSQADEFGPIFECKNHAVAIRKCKNEFKGVGGLSDFELLHIGEFDHETGVFGSYSENLSMGSLADICSDVKEIDK